MVTAETPQIAGRRGGPCNLWCCCDSAHIDVRVLLGRVADPESPHVMSVRNGR